jgi:hypothetical protein
METSRGQAGELTDTSTAMGATCGSHMVLGSGFLPSPDFAKLDSLMAKLIGAISFPFQRRQSDVGFERRSEKP